ncbi:SPFH/Band 7/PHB domain protein [Emcibacteraceae bacterium]|nr:SPFH/Band 7/PHB domain protein [Emcibacteraceae bacterium]
MDEIGFTLFLIILAVAIIIFVAKGFHTVPESSVRLVERLGKYNRTFRPGINFLIPFIEKLKIPDITTYDRDPTDPENSKTKMRYLVNNSGDIPLFEILLDPPAFDAISSDNAIVFPDAVLQFRIVDPVKATYEVENLGMALYTLLMTTLRQEVGIRSADEIIVSRQAIGATVREALEEASSPWGTVISRVEIEEIRFDKEVTAALSDQRVKELEGRAVVAESEKKRESLIIDAEASKKAIILAAEAKFEQEKLEAEADYLKASRVLEGQAKGTEALAMALEKNPQAVVALEALKAQIEVAKAIGASNNTLIIPEETAGIFGALKSISKVLDFKVSDKS